MKIEYYYSLMSPWAYFGAQRFYELQSKYNFSIIHKPLDIMTLFPLSGGEPLGKRADQRKAYRIMEMKRWQKKLNISINLTPKFFPPTDVSKASCMILSLKDKKKQNELSFTFLKQMWLDEKDIGDKVNLKKACEDLNINFNELYEESKGKIELYGSLAEKAAKLNIFGSPTYLVNDEIFWGQDRLELLEDYIK